MKPTKTLAWWAGFLLLYPALTGAAGDASRGAQLFRQCAACHSTAPGEHLTGPSLSNIWKRHAASVPGFLRYSDALKHLDVTWTEAALDKWLADPAGFAPGTTMTLRGIADRRDREDLIAYLKAVSENAVPAAPARRIDLRNAPPEGQVRSIKYCGDTYTVQTADGRSEKIGEFNLRFKTDSSERGPYPGKPVALGAGMRGDRAAIVFASPGEISGFVERSCP